MRTQQGTDFVSLLYAKTNIDAKVNWYTVFRKSRRKFPGPSNSQGTTYLRHENNINFEPWMIEYKKLRSASFQTFWEITFLRREGNFVIVLLVAQINRKIESDIAGIQRAPWLSYRGMFTRQTVKHLCQMMARYRVFVSFFFCQVL